MTKTCIFCAPANEIILADELVYTTFDRFPVSPGHVLVIPKRHCATIFDATLEERAAMMKILDDLKNFLDQKYNPSGYNIGINCGHVAGQTINHCHVHVIPRYSGDVANPRGGVRGVIPEKQGY